MSVVYLVPYVYSTLINLSSLRALRSSQAKSNLLPIPHSANRLLNGIGRASVRGFSVRESM